MGYLKELESSLVDASSSQNQIPLENSPTRLRREETLPVYPGRQPPAYEAGGSTYEDTKDCLGTAKEQSGGGPPEGFV